MDALANEFITAIIQLSEKPENIENFKIYLSYHFPEWIEKFANTPEKITAEIKAFSQMEV